MLLARLAATLLLAVSTVAAAQGTPPLANVLDLDAVVTSEVAPDLAIVTMAIVREGSDVAPLTKDVNETLAKAFADAKAVPGVVAANGGYSTSPRFDTRDGQSTSTGWQVRAELVLKSRDFAALGTLVGRLSQSLQIAGSGFEISPELRARETASLIDRGARAFQDKATMAAKAFGYSGFSIRQVTVGNADQNGGGRVFAAMEPTMKTRSAAPLPVESGRVTLSLTVNGSVQMR